MARITVEDCLEKVENRFELVLLATKRAREIDKGAQAMVPRGKDKPTVIALREIAEGLYTREIADEEDRKRALESQYTAALGARRDFGRDRPTAADDFAEGPIVPEVTIDKPKKRGRPKKDKG